MFQTQIKKQTNKHQKTTPGRDPNEKEISDLTDKEFKIMFVNLFTKIIRPMLEENENFNTETGNRRKYQMEIIELKNIITELKNLIEGFKQQTRSSR